MERTKLKEQVVHYFALFLTIRCDSKTEIMQDVKETKVEPLRKNKPFFSPFLGSN